MASGSMSPVGAQCHIQVWHGTEHWLPSSYRSSLLGPALSVPRRLTHLDSSHRLPQPLASGRAQPLETEAGGAGLELPSFLSARWPPPARMAAQNAMPQSISPLSLFLGSGKPILLLSLQPGGGGVLRNPRTLGELLVGLKEQVQERRASTGW